MQVSENLFNNLQDLNSSAGTRFLKDKKETFLKISAAHRMSDFLMNLVSPEDQWMYITSNGALTAGRRNADNALFPYYTQDKLIDLAETTGSFTSIWKQGTSNANNQNWKPFTKNRAELPYIQRNLYKSPEGNEVIFEERNTLLNLQFSYLWTFSPHFGFARYAELTNIGKQSVKISLLDGLQNLLPYGLDQNFANRFSNLSDAYKKCELVTPENVGIYYLSSIPTDRAEPSEGLRSTIAWSLNYQPDHILLSGNQLDSFQDQKPLFLEEDIRGQRCSYLLHKELELEPGAHFQGWIVADINQDAGAIEDLLKEIQEPSQLTCSLIEDIGEGLENIRNKIASADGYQLSNDPQRCSRHLSNVLFNIMRGGIFVHDYQIPRDDFLLHLRNFNRSLYSKFGDALARLPPEIHFRELLTRVKEHSDPDLLRLTMEYLPLTFSRRHGDPSRPWNAFSIDTTDAEGNPILAYQGNWRDIFQNWEALAYSFPEFLEGMIFRFLNASTADGYNPYRLTKDGFEWELLDPEEPWSNIGYWGDHQIVYLLKLLELSFQKDNTRLAAILDEPHFVYADVPYRIANFEQTWGNPRDTVAFDDLAQQSIEDRVSELGTDGKLVVDHKGMIVKVSLLEKLLNPLLSKLSNFVPEGGIWLNTQRPEWNDANNALVGNGLSVVTMGYIHRYLDFLLSLLGQESLPETCEISQSVYDLIQKINDTFSNHSDQLSTALSDQDRYAITRELGEAGSTFRKEVYAADQWESRKEISLNQTLQFVKLARSWIKHSLEANKRPDGLFHSYNLMRQGKERIGVEYLYEMLEGQVSILSSTSLSSSEAAKLLDTLRKSSLYLEDRGSYLLYPDRELPRFLQKGIIQEEQVSLSPVLKHLLQIDDRSIVYQDARGQTRFNGAFRNVEDLKQSLQSIRSELLADFSNRDVHQVESLFEETFQHHSFTGRSGTFFAYEGLGSIYWHMVSKLVLAIQETYTTAQQQDCEEEVLDRLADHYYETLKGLGIYQTPAEYGAFPSDPYSHTPGHSGAQQPGMTGQVKEDILVRWGELGINIQDRCLSFEPRLLRSEEFLNQPEQFHFVSMKGDQKWVDLKSNEMAFTFCQVPVVYSLGDEVNMTLTLYDGTAHTQQSTQLSEELSQSIFSRDGKVELIRVQISPSKLR